MTGFSEAMHELLEARTWPDVAACIQTHAVLSSEDGRALLTQIIDSPDADDYLVSMMEDLRASIFESGADAVTAIRERVDLSWPESREIFGQDASDVLSWYQEYDDSGDRDALDQAGQLVGQLHGDARLATTPTGFQLYVSDAAVAVDLARYAEFGDGDDLQAALDTLRDALDRTDERSRLRARRLTNYVNALLRHADLSGDITEVSTALAAARKALSMTDPDDPLWPGRANNLAAALAARFDNSQSNADLDEAVGIYDEALAATPEGSPARARLLHGKGATWRRRYATDRTIQSLEESIRWFRAAVDTPPGPPERPLLLCDLGIALATRFEELGNAPDLDEGIGRMSEALEAPGGAQTLIQRCTGALAIAYRTRFEQRGDREDLRRACRMFRSALLSSSTADPGHRDALQRYGMALQRLVAELETALLASPARRDLRYELGQGLWELYEISRVDSVRDRAVEAFREAGRELPGQDDLYCNRVFRTIDAIGDALLTLYGRDVFNVFAAFGHCIQQEIYDLINEGQMDTELRPAQPSGLVVLPRVSWPTTRRMRYAWDYFVFIYMSHKLKNIKRRQMASGLLDLPIILYLRGADYQLAVSEGAAGVGFNTTQDFNFGRILDPLADRFEVLKALSPADLNWAMKEIGLYLATKGNYLSSVAEFARASDAGVFLNPATWRTVVLDLFPSASLYLVYVSNQSNGLMYEIDTLSDLGLEKHTILVLDGERFGARASFFAMQEGLEAEGKHLYEHVVRDASAVEDPDAFERLLARFPHTVALTDDAAAVQREIEALIPVVRRADAEAPLEVPFDFHVNLNQQQADDAADLRQRISDRIHSMASQQTISNWSVFLLYLQIDVFLSLTSGRPLDAALSTARCAAIADVVREHAEESDTPEETDELQLAGDIAMNVGYDAFAMGEWNDYTDRRALSRELVDGAAVELGDLMRRSISAAQRVVVRATHERPPAEEPDAHVQLATDLLTQCLRSDVLSGGTDRA